MRDLARRLEVLERSAPVARVLPCFVNEGETQGEALSRHFPAGVPDRARVLFVSWLPTQEGGAS
jgi:hypothetical protein